MGWRSQEQSHQFKQRSEKMKSNSPSASKGSRYGSDDMVPEGLPDKFFNEDGEIDLSKVTGAEARKYMGLIGIKLPIGTSGKAVVMRD